MMSYGYQPEWSEGSIKCPIFQTSTFVFKSAEEGKAFFEVAYGLREKEPGEVPGLIYSRINNPDLEILEDRLVLWDHAEEAAVFQSGMAAITTTLLALLEPGDTILHSDPLYGGTEYLLAHVLPRFGINVVGFRAGIDRDEIERTLEDSGHAGTLKVVFIETPANPTNRLVDIEECVEIARERSSGDRRVLVVVDNTFLGPLWQRPLQHGADLVIYSATKFIGGHSDVIAGVCLGPGELIDPVKSLRSILGSMAGPWTGWLLLRSLETLKLRMTCQMKNAGIVADYLKDHPRVDRVYYLGHLTEEDPQYPVYRKQCVAPGSMIAFDIHGGQNEAFRFLNSLKLFKLAVSLGGTESLAEHPGTMTHSDISPEDQRGMGITDKMIRLSVGVENPEDLVADLQQALDV
jgi:methionine-gamma-lyase